MNNSLEAVGCSTRHLLVSWALELGWPIALLVALALPALIWLISIIYTHPGAQPRIGTLAQITPGYYSCYHKSLKTAYGSREAQAGHFFGRQRNTVVWGGS